MIRLAAIISLILCVTCSMSAQHNHDGHDHSGHDHSGHNHAGNDHSAHADHSGHGH